MTGFYRMEGERFARGANNPPFPVRLERMGHPFQRRSIGPVSPVLSGHGEVSEEGLDEGFYGRVGASMVGSVKVMASAGEEL
jgi:hypothetical protein